MKSVKITILFFTTLCLFWANAMTSIARNFSGNNPNSSLLPVKLLFIHHSVGGHWLAHDFRGLVNERNKNNFYVNDVTYGWEPPTLTDSIVKKVKHNALKKLGKADRGSLRYRRQD